MKSSPFASHPRLPKYWPIAWLAACSWLASVTIVVAEEPSVASLTQQLIAANGGEDRILKLFRMKELLSIGSDPAKKGSVRQSVIEPPKSWWIGKKERGEEPAKFLVWAWTLGALADSKSKIERLPESEENGRPVIGLRVSETISPPLDLFFEKSGLQLVRIEWRADIHRFSDWKELDGTRYPSKCVGYKRESGKPWYFSEIVELERLVELPEGLTR